jgi:hypothetical protein
MPDYAGAVAAIKALLVQNWVDGSNNPKTPIYYANKQPDLPFPPIGSTTGNQEPCIICEVTGSKSDIYTFGNAGNRFWLYDGLIILSCLVAINDGDETAQSTALAAAEIFRAKTFYVDANGSYIRTVAPNPPDGGSAANIEGVQAGSSWRSTCTIPFQYFHRA